MYSSRETELILFNLRPFCNILIINMENRQYITMDHEIQISKDKILVDHYIIKVRLLQIQKTTERKTMYTSCEWKV